MASTHLIRIGAIMRYFHLNDKLLDRGVNSYESNNIVCVKFDADLMVIRGEVSASMKQKSYKQKVKLHSI